MNFGVDVNTYDKSLTFGYFGGKFLPFHMGHLWCIIKASQMVDVLFVVVTYDDEWDKQLCKNTKFKWVDHSVRERWITKSVKDLPNVRVLSVYEKRFKNWHNRPEIHESTKKLIESVGGKIDIVFSSENEYDEYFKEYFPNTKHIVLDPERKVVNISATEIRKAGVYKLWDYLPKSVQEYYTKRVCLSGIESSGKSTLTKILATLYNTNYVEEYGRTYYDEIGGFHEINNPHDLINIAMGHNHKINEAIQHSNKLLFIDTDNIYTQFYHITCYNKENPVLAELIKANASKIDLHILIEPRNPHELDGTRRPVTDAERWFNFRLIKELFDKYGIKYKIIKSSRDIDECIKIINELIDAGDDLDN